LYLCKKDFGQKNQATGAIGLDPMRRRHWLEVSPTGVEEVDECLKIEELGAHLIAVHSTRHVIEVHSVVGDTDIECLYL